MNNCSFAGRCGKDDPTIKDIGGTKIAECSMAVYRYAKEKENQTLWVRVKAFGKTAETLAQFVKKGEMFGVSGQLDCDKWTDKDGNKRETWLIKANNIHLLSSGTAGSGTKPAAEPEEDEADPFK